MNKVDVPSKKHIVTIRQKKLARKKAFGLFEASKVLKTCSSGKQWSCCGIDFTIPKSMHTHVAKQHDGEINEQVECLLQEPKLLTSSRHVSGDKSTRPGRIPTNYDSNQSFPWLPSEEDVKEKLGSSGIHEHEVLLFYHYGQLEDPHDICSWQQKLCERLHLNGKIRIAKEGINGTVGGTVAATVLYIEATLSHPAFTNLQIDDFKTSKGSGQDFSQGLTVRVCNEIVQMGIEPSNISHIDAGKHITASEFHQKLENLKASANNTVFVDCRNFYESKVGRFDGALTPDIRKFSYWPEYVDKNVSLFENKDVIMYCTGGIRCERGSAYLRSKGVCKNVLQLEGGIHRYIEQYPNGFFKGKLFVFDDRFTISSNDSIVAECSYCGKPFDQYKPCTTQHCHQLVLSCDQCRLLGKTACCEVCQKKDPTDCFSQKMMEECTCTKKRLRIPINTTDL